MEPRYPNLVQLLGGYFHQDWIVEAASAENVLATIVREESAEKLRAGLHELDVLLGSGLCEPQLRDAILYEIGCYFEPGSEGLDVSVWLRQVRDRLHRARD